MPGLQENPSIVCALALSHRLAFSAAWRFQTQRCIGWVQLSHDVAMGWPVPESL
jgi:hypothetical protein